MSKYTLLRFQKHWKILKEEFRFKHQEWQTLISDILCLESKLHEYLEGGKELSKNCSLLLLSKAINHILAMLTLFERGLIIDGALSARNAVETLLMLQLFAKDGSKRLFKKWSQGQQFTPSWVRKKLTESPEAVVNDVVINIDSENFETYRIAYNWLSSITHSNLDSLNYTVKKQDVNSFAILIGGSLEGKEPFINAVFMVICNILFETILICTAIFYLPFLESSKDKFQQLYKRINEMRT